MLEMGASSMAAAALDDMVEEVLEITARACFISAEMLEVASGECTVGAEVLEMAVAASFVAAEVFHNDCLSLFGLGRTNPQSKMFEFAALCNTAIRSVLLYGCVSKSKDEMNIFHAMHR